MYQKFAKYILGKNEMSYVLNKKRKKKKEKKNEKKENKPI